MEANDRTYLGIDLGGTKLLAGLMKRDGTLLYSCRYATGPIDQQRAAEIIFQAIDQCLRQQAEKPAAIGIGLVGRIDSREGKWLEIDPARMDSLPLAEKVSARYGIPCFLDNDVRSATKAEMMFGRGKSSGDLIYLNVGTGVAAGIVTGGQLMTGGHCNAGEVGHTTSGLALKTPCICGRSDCVEMVCSGLGFDHCARMLRKKYPDTALFIPANSRVSVKEVFEHYEDDALCRILTDNAAEGLANLVMNLVRVSDPDTVVMGGGIVADGFLYEKMLQHLNKHTMRFVTGGVVLTQLDASRIGLMGACSNAIEGMGA